MYNLYRKQDTALWNGVKKTTKKELKPTPIRRYQIPNSLNIFRKKEIIEKLNKDDEIIVYCTETACNESANLYYLLEHMGY